MSVLAPYRSESSGNGDGSDTSLTTTFPAGAVAGDALILTFIVYGSVVSSLSTPTGWTKQSATLNSGAGFTMAVYTRSFGDTAPTVSWTGSTEAFWWMQAFAACDVTTPVDKQAAKTGSSTGPNVSTVTTTVPALLVWTLYHDNNTRTDTVPSGFTSRVSSPGRRTADMQQSAAAATGTITGAISSSDNWVAALVALKPAVSADPASSVTDDFGRSDQSPISGDWVSNVFGAGDTKIVSDALASVSGEGEAGYIPTLDATKLAETGFTVTTSSGGWVIGLYGNVAGLYGLKYDGTSVSIVRNDGAGNTTLTAAVSGTDAAADKYRIRYDPATGVIEARRYRTSDGGWELKARAVDTTYNNQTTWNSYIQIDDTTTRIDDFYQGNPGSSPSSSGFFLLL